MLVVTISLYRVLCYFSSQSGLFWNTSFTFPSPHICLHYSCAWKYPFLLLVSRSCVCMCAQSCLTLCDPMDCSPPGCSVHGISQARILEWIAISYFRGSSQKGLNLHLFASPALAGRFFTTWATGEASGSPTHLLRHSAKSSLNNHNLQDLQIPWRRYFLVSDVNFIGLVWWWKSEPLRRDVIPLIQVSMNEDHNRYMPLGCKSQVWPVTKNVKLFHYT